ncbi:hypothetical protein KK062_07705 [Fulvivirgaceae bacterium PWU5]|uniref:Collagen-like protein n=1 Tax=Dawidia cretensis TaxID=2782350 RepID=A0AAP2GUW9_9BACT|nr:collagen-like protein [Dawidia cretensis]MBT1708102.1 hypothetical protein [Dawidia cretensis]
MKQLLKFGLMFTIATSGLMFTACEGEDGDPGAVGPQGEKGDKGDTGEQGLGFDEAVQYGNIAVQFKGTRADNVTFNKTIDFKFCPTGPDASYYSYASPYQTEGGTSVTEFRIERFNSVVVSDDSEGGSNSSIRFRFNKYEEEESYIDLDLNVAIVSDDMKFFTLWDDYSEITFSEVVSEYSFNSVTSELKFKFHLIVPEESNSTGHDLEITADVNTKVLQYIYVD